MKSADAVKEACGVVADILKTTGGGIDYTLTTDGVRVRIIVEVVR